MSTTEDKTLRVSNATIFYRVRGTGPLLLILPGGDGDADAANALCEQLVTRHTVVTYDRRGISRSKIDAPCCGDRSLRFPSQRFRPFRVDRLPGTILLCAHVETRLTGKNSRRALIFPTCSYASQSLRT
jgi:pimeloyl-ACP methyl ester carboxylesterase